MFYPFGSHWRWWSWAEAARRLAEPAEPSEPAAPATPAPPPERKPWHDPEALLAWMAAADPTEADSTGFGAAFSAARDALGPALADRARPGTRDAWVAGDLSLARNRELLAWCLVTDSVVALPWRAEKIPQPRVTAAAWLRPTIFSGDAAELAALDRAITDAPRRRLVAGYRALAPSWRTARRRPWGRLHTVVTDRGPTAGWADRGVQVLQRP